VLRCVRVEEGFEEGERLCVKRMGNALRHAATHCNTLQRTATRCNTERLWVRDYEVRRMGNALDHAATHCNTLQHTATHCNTLQHTATHCNTLQHTATPSWEPTSIITPSEACGSTSPALFAQSSPVFCKIFRTCTHTNEFNSIKS